MSTFLLYLLAFIFALVCIFLILTILLQSGKGGGLSSLGSGAGGAISDTLGATGAEKTLVKATSWAAAIFMVLALVLTLWGAHLQRSGGLLVGDIRPASAPAAPAQAPAAEGGAPASTTGGEATQESQAAPAPGQSNP